MVRDQPAEPRSSHDRDPATGTAEGLRALVRIRDGTQRGSNLSTHREGTRNAPASRDVQETIGRPLALIADLQGPKLRIGNLPDPVTLARGDEVSSPATRVRATASCRAAGGDRRGAAAGHEVLIDDGLVRLRVERIRSGAPSAPCSPAASSARTKGVNLPGVPVPIPSLTRKDMDDLDSAMALDVDFVALSFVRAAADVRDLKESDQAAGSTANVIAKIEKAEAVDALDAILQDADAVMVARGRLGVEMRPELVPLLQSGSSSSPRPRQTSDPRRRRC